MNELNIEELQKQAEEANEKKGMLGAFGGALQNVANVPTAYEQLHLGGQSRGPNIKGMFDSAAGMVKDPWEKQKKTYEMFKAANDQKNAERLAKRESELDETDSMFARAAKARALKSGKLSPEEAKNLTARQAMALFGDPGKMSEIEASSMAGLSKEMEMEKVRERARSREKDLDRKHELGKFAIEHGIKKAEKDKEKLDKKQQAMAEVEDRRQNINASLANLQEMIKEDGTFEAIGPHNQNLDRLVEQIATDMAKLQDPSSVARPSEVESVKKNLIKSGFQNSNSTALDILEKFKGEVDRRADLAYKVRGLNSPAANDEMKDAASWALANPDDPRAKKILEKTGNKLGAK